jgi:hypothetical protein
MFLNVKFDIDGVLLEWYDWFYEYMASKGFRIIPTGHWNFRVAPEISQNQLLELIADSMRYPDRVAGAPGARPFLEELWNFSHKPLQMITHRTTTVATETHQAIHMNVAQNIHYSIAFVNRPQDKGWFTQDVDCFFDDKPETCFQLAALGKTVFCPRKGYNENDIRLNTLKIRVEHINSVGHEVVKNLGQQGSIVFYDHFGDLMDSNIIRTFFLK